MSTLATPALYKKEYLPGYTGHVPSKNERPLVFFSSPPNVPPHSFRIRLNPSTPEIVLVTGFDDCLQIVALLVSCSGYTIFNLNVPSLSRNSSSSSRMLKLGEFGNKGFSDRASAQSSALLKRSGSVCLKTSAHPAPKLYVPSSHSQAAKQP